MGDAAKAVFSNLKEAVEIASANKEKYVARPGKDFSRDRKLSFSQTILSIFSMQGGSLNVELSDFYQREKIQISKPGFVQQRQKLKPHVFRDILLSFNDLCKYDKRYKGYRLLTVDGSDFNIANNPKTEAAIYDTQGNYMYSQLHVNALYDLVNNIYVDAIIQPRKVADEQLALWKFEERNAHRTTKALYIVDRGYESYNTLAHFIESDSADLLLRVKTGKGSLRIIQSLPMKEYDCDVKCELTNTQKNEDKLNNRVFICTGSTKGKELSSGTRVGRFDFPTPYMLKIRVVRFRLSTGEYETILTTLPRESFPLEEIKKLYAMRWGIEISFRELKYALSAIAFHSKSIEGSKLEIFASLLKYNVCEHIIADVVVSQKKENQYQYRVNHTSAIRIILQFFRTHQTDVVELYNQIRRFVEPWRPGRHDKRKTIVPKSFVYFTYRIAA